MGAKCCARDSGQLAEEGDMNARLDLNGMGINEFENRVKKYAHSANRGKITVEQLMEAFKDTKIFTQINNPQSVVNRVIMSPFFTTLTLTHNELTPEELAIEQEDKTRCRSVSPQPVAVELFGPSSGKVQKQTIVF